MQKEDWDFNKLEEDFYSHALKHIPYYDDMHAMIKDLAGWYVEDDTNVFDIGTSLGNVIYNIKNAYSSRNINYYGVDTSKKMIDTASVIFSQDSNVHMMQKNILDKDFCVTNASLVTSVLTLMFLPYYHRIQALNKIYAGLNEGGALILVEKVNSPHSDLNSVWTELYHEKKKENGVSEEEIFAKAKSIRGVLKPLTEKQNYSLLKNAGFNKIDSFFKWGHFVGIIAIK